MLASIILILGFYFSTFFPVVSASEAMLKGIEDEIKQGKGTIFPKPPADLAEIDKAYKQREGILITNREDTTIAPDVLTRNTKALDDLRKLYLELLPTEIKDFNTQKGEKLEKILEAKEDTVGIKKVWEDGITDNFDKYTYADLEFAQKRLRMLLDVKDDNVKTADLRVRRAYNLLNRQFAVLIPKATDHKDIADKEDKRIPRTPSATDFDDFLFNTGDQRDDQLVLSRNYAVKKAILPLSAYKTAHENLRKAYGFKMISLIEPNKNNREQIADAVFKVPMEIEESASQLKENLDEMKSAITETKDPKENDINKDLDYPELLAILVRRIKAAHPNDDDTFVAAIFEELQFKSGTGLLSDVVNVVEGQYNQLKTEIDKTTDSVAKLDLDEAFLLAKMGASDYHTPPLTPTQKDTRKAALTLIFNLRRLTKREADLLKMFEGPKDETELTKKHADKKKKLEDYKKEISADKITDEEETKQNSLLAVLVAAVQAIDDGKLELEKILKNRPKPAPPAGGGGGAPTGGGGGAPTGGGGGAPTGGGGGAPTGGGGGTQPAGQPGGAIPDPLNPQMQQEQLNKEFDRNPPVPEPNCADLAQPGSCNMRMCRIKGYVVNMHRYCRKTCRVCIDPNEPCDDRNPFDCPMWASQGYCESPSYSKAMKMAQCARTCGLCPTQSAGRR